MGNFQIQKSLFYLVLLHCLISGRRGGEGTGNGGWIKCTKGAGGGGWIINYQVEGGYIYFILL